VLLFTHENLMIKQKAYMSVVISFVNLCNIFQNTSPPKRLNSSCDIQDGMEDRQSKVSPSNVGDHFSMICVSEWWHWGGRGGMQHACTYHPSRYRIWGKCCVSCVCEIFL